MKYNRNFAKLENGIPKWCPIPLTVVTHHHEEWDVDIIDQETGEPTGEKEHKERDWDTTEIKRHPTSSDCLQMGYLPVIDKPPTEPVPEGYHYEPGDYGKSQDGETIVRNYNTVQDPHATLADYDSAMERHLRSEREARGYTTREPDVYLSSSNERWSQDAKDWVSHRDSVMEYALNLMNSVLDGSVEPPTVEEFIDGLPKITWTIG